MGIPNSHGRAARPGIVRLTDTDIGAVPDGATDGILLTLADAKDYLNLDHDQDDGLISTLIHAAEACAESELNRDLRARAYQAVFATADTPHTQFFSTGRPAASVSAVQMWDASGALTTLDADGEDAEYAVRSGRGSERIIVLDSETLETYRQGSEDGDLMLISFATVDATSANLHGYWAIRRAVMHMVAGGYETREAETQGPAVQVNPAPERLLRPYRYHLNLAGGA